ncbi:cold-shock protein [Labrenzia sp. OB1]|uniref:cold-shock protein n=1 Tax=Labrenzia sp. OB1 TaxID=1561204 RepID=UPI0009EE8F87|nr:cold-shock protein [Labrenzia sp. OB1]
MQIGTVKFWNAKRGFGFITPHQGGPDIFVHISAVVRAGLIGLEEGQVVAFDVEVTKNGRRSAVNIDGDTDDPGPSFR